MHHNCSGTISHCLTRHDRTIKYPHMKFIKLLCLSVLASLFFACGDDEECINGSPELIQENAMEIESYLASNGLTADVTQNGLFYIIEEEGDGTFPTLNNSVTVHYRGYLTNGDQFDSSYDRGAPATFPLRNVILGWQEGIPLFSKGGKGKLIIPHHLGYGCFPPNGSNIPAGGVLVFDVELIDFQ